MTPGRSATRFADMTTTSRRAVALGLGTAAAIGISGAVGTGPAAAQSAACTPQFLSSSSSFISSLCGMPDYDQRRTAGVLQGDGRTINVSNLQIGPVNYSLALAGNGGCHCVPTSFTNLLGYYTGKGVQGNFPRGFNWDARAGYLPRPNVEPATYLNGQAFPAAEVAAYNSATVAIKTLGKDVKTGDAGCGTSWSTVLKYFGQLRSLYPKVYLAIATKSPEFAGPKSVANILAAGGVVSIAYGRYENYSETDSGSDTVSNSASWGARKGGHAVTVRQIKGVNLANKNAEFLIHDPASNADPAEAGDTDRYRQSATEAKVVPLTRLYNSSEGIHRWRYGAKKESGNQAIWDSMLVAYPVFAVMSNGTNVGLLPGVKFNQQGVPAGPGPATQLTPKSFKLGTAAQPVLDAAFLPATGEIAYIRKGDGSVRAIGVGTRETRVLGEAPKGATQLEVDPTGGRVFVGGTSEIVQLSPGSEKGDRAVTKIPSAVRALTFDPGSALGAGRVLAITGDRNLRKLQPGTLTQVGASQKLSASLFEGTGPVSATVDTKGQLFLRRGSSTRIGRVGLGTRKVSRGSIGALQGTGGLAFGERGSVFTVIGGKLSELTPGGKAVADSPFAGRRGFGRVLQVTRTGSDVPAELANQIIDERVVDPEYPEMAP